VRGVEYSIKLVGRRVLDGIDRPVVMEENWMENRWRLTILNDSQTPLMDEVTVENRAGENRRELPGWPRTIILNPGENISVDLPGQPLVFRSKLGGTAYLSQEPPAPPKRGTSGEDSVMVALLLTILIGPVATLALIDVVILLKKRTVNR
jgi:hypothetical protein